MQLFTDNTVSKLSNVSNGNMLFQRLDRNKKDIAQCYAKLSSYVCEPRTYEQYTWLSELKDSARKLRDANESIFSTLRKEGNTTVRDLRLFENHLQRFQSFSENVLVYIEKVKVHRTACI